MVKAEKQKGDFQAINPGGVQWLLTLVADRGGISLGWGVEIRF